MGRASRFKTGQQFDEAGIIPPCAFELASQRPLRSVFLHDVQRHVPEHGQIVWAIAQPGPVPILVHHDIGPPVQPVFDASVRSDDLVEPFWG